LEQKPMSLQALEAEILPRLDRVDLVVVRLPLVHPFGTSVHVWTHKEALLLRVESGGVVAWSECVADPDPFYAYETTSTARHILKEFLLPLVEPGMPLGELESRFNAVRGHRMARATLDNALIHLIALQKGLPLHALLGRPAKRIMSGISIGLRDTPAELLQAVERAVANKYHRVKIKIKKGQDIEWIRTVRKRFPDLAMMVDANGGYSLADAEHLRQLDAFNLTMIEQPLSYDDIYQHSLLQQQLSTSICLDECIHSMADAETALALGACRVINVKQGRVGGLLESMRIAQFGREHNIPIWSGGMDETGIGRAVNIHLQTIDGFDLPGDTSATSNYFTEDIVDPPVLLDAEGFITIPPGSGLGVSILPERLAKYTIGWERYR
jgi:o-succinylbenzoate synthase